MLDEENHVFIVGYENNAELGLVRKNNMIEDDFDISKLLCTIPRVKHRLDPYLIGKLKDIKCIAICQDYGLALTNNSEIYQFIYQSSADNKEPFLLIHDVKEPINSVDLFIDSPIILTKNFNAHTASDKYFTECKFPVPYVVQYAIGGYHMLLLSLTGQVYSSGLNEYGQLGLGNNENCESWTIIPNLNNIIKIAAGQDHSLFLTADEKVYACGKNDQGQLGLGNLNNVNIPTLVMDLKQ